MRAVNLLPLDARAQKQSGLSSVNSLSPTRIVRTGGAVAGTLVVLLGLLYVHERSTVHSKQRQLAETAAQVQSLQAKVDKIQATQRAAQARVSIVQSVSKSRMNWDTTLMDLAKVIPSGVFLQNLTAAAATTASVSTSGPASTFTVAGSAPSYKGTASVLDRLALLPWLSAITLQTSARQGDGTVTFSVQGTVVPSGGAR
jgi:Tfp pilus assembly protein PilN